MDTYYPLIVIVGETASGKSAVAMRIAQKFGGEIICADSWTVYRGFDIGTAKPSLDDQKSIPHHLLDVADAKKGFSAAEFKRRATAAINDIQKRRKLPILVGGTGLYIDSVIFDYGFLPAGPKDQRSQLNDLSINELLERISKAGYSLEGIDVRNKRRLIRLIEAKGQRPAKQKIRPNTLIIGLKTPSDKLLERINDRVDTMLSSGLEKEAQQLADRYGWSSEPMKGIGYQEFKDYFEGRQSLAQTRQRIVSGSARLAKKQRTWFKRNKYIQWLDDPSKIVAIVTTFLNT